MEMLSSPEAGACVWSRTSLLDGLCCSEHRSFHGISSPRSAWEALGGFSLAGEAEAAPPQGSHHTQPWQLPLVLSSPLPPQLPVAQL